jgi:hypothetical protein
MPRKDQNPGDHERAALLRQRALDLRVEGKTFRQIGQELGCDHSTALRHVRAALAEASRQSVRQAAHLRRLELLRCDRLWAALQPGVTRGDPKAVLAAIKVLDRAAKYLNLDAPKKVARTDPTGEREATGVGDDLGEFVALLDAVAAARAGGAAAGGGPAPPQPAAAGGAGG